MNNTPQNRARQMDDLVPNLTPRLWKNQSKDVVKFVLGHGEGHRGLASGKYVVQPGEEVYIDRKYDRAIQSLAPQMHPVEPFEMGQGPQRARTADDLVPEVAATKPRRSVEVVKEKEPSTKSAQTQAIQQTAPTQTSSAKRDEE